MIFLFDNFAETTLAFGLAQASTTVFVPQTDSERFSQPGTGEVLAVTLADGYQEPEVAYITSNPRNGTMVLLRGQEGTAAKDWPAGSQFVHTLTRASILWFSTGGASDLIAALQAELDAAEAQIAALQGQVVALQSYVDNADADLQASIEQSNASISVLAQVVADNNYALSSITTTLMANVASNTANITTIYSTIATNQSAQATINSSLTASINGVSSSLTSFQSAQATQNGAFTSAISTLTASYGDQQAQITTTQTAVATLNGNLSGKYTIAISAGRFASLELAAGSGTSSYSYLALRIQDFYISDPSGQYTPFYFNTGTSTAYLQNVYITNAVIENLTITNTKIGYNQISNRLVSGNSLTYGLSTGFRTQIAAFSYTSGGGPIEFSTSITMESLAAGDTYPQLYLVVDGSDLLSVPWYIKGLTFDAREFSVDVFVGAGSHSFSVEAMLAGGSTACQTRRQRIKVEEFLR